MPVSSPICEGTPFSTCIHIYGPWGHHEGLFNSTPLVECPPDHIVFAGEAALVLGGPWVPDLLFCVTHVFSSFLLMGSGPFETKLLRALSTPSFWGLVPC